MIVIFNAFRFIFDHAIWHWGENSDEGSEHTLYDAQYPMELQLFHYNTKYLNYETASLHSDGLAAVSFFYENSARNNTAIDSLLEPIGTLEEEVLNMGVEFEVPLTVDTLGALLPQDGLQLWDNYYYYSGSQTLPNDAKNCTEPVLWIVYEKTIPISEAQITPFRRLLSAANDIDGADPPCVHNFRPVHPLFYANDTGSYFCEGGFLCTLAQIFGGIIDGGFGTNVPIGRQLGKVGTSAGRKSLYCTLYISLKRSSSRSIAPTRNSVLQTVHQHT